MNYGLSSKMPSINIPYDLAREVECMDWFGTPECRIWLAFHSRSVRAKMKSHILGTYIFKKYYRNGMVVSWFTQKDVVEALGYSNGSAVSKIVKSLKNKNILKEHEDKFNGNSIKLYETGEVFDVEGQLESVYLFKYLRQEIAKRELAKYK